MKIVILCSECDSTCIVYKRLRDEFGEVYLIIEEPVSSIRLIGRRISKLGLKKVIGQVLFKLMIEPCLKIESRKRKREILDQYQIELDHPYQKQEFVYHVESVNSAECRRSLQELDPDLVVVNGTRIIGKETIHAVKVPMINLHMGITPKYRGVHGAYWALASDDSENCGVTVHWIDEGIDTGKIISQERISYTPKDNFCTYPYLQAIVGAELEAKAIRDYENGKMHERSNQLPSRLWSHPTLVEYLKHRKNGVK